MRHYVQEKEGAGLVEKLHETHRETLRTLTESDRRRVVEHTQMVRAMAWRLYGCGVALDDLRQEGFLGLCEATRRYDESLGCTFATYAAHWCRKKMLLAIAHYGNPMRLPERDCRLARFYRLDLGENPQGEEDEMRADRLLAAPCRQQEDEEMLRKAQLERIDEALRKLKPCEREIVENFYGIDCERLNISEIASAMGISQARAYALHLRALRHLEKALADKPLVDYLDRHC